MCPSPGDCETSLTPPPIKVFGVLRRKLHVVNLRNSIPALPQIVRPVPTNDQLPLASWFGPFRHFVLAHPWDVKGLGNIHPVVVAAVGMWESLLSDFQGLWEGWETVSSFSHAFHGPSFPPPLSVDFTAQASSCCWMTAFASCCVFCGNGRTLNPFR